MTRLSLRLDVVNTLALIISLILFHPLAPKPYAAAAASTPAATTTVTSTVASESPLILDQNKTYLVFSCNYGNLNNQLNIVLNTLYAVYKSPHRAQIRVVMPRLRSGANVFDDMFENALGFDWIPWQDFFGAANVDDVLKGTTFYGSGEESVVDAKSRRFGATFFDQWEVKIENIFPRSDNCGYLKWVDGGYENCVQWNLEKATRKCKSFVIPPTFTNMQNCSKTARYTDWSEFRAKFYVPTQKYKEVVQSHIRDMERPIMAIHFRFLPFGFGHKLYREPYGQWFEGQLPKGFSIPLFIQRSKQLYQCLQVNHSWQIPKSIYLLGWPQTVNAFKAPIATLGAMVYTRKSSHSVPKLDGIFVDELVALEADYFHSSYRSTLTLNIAEARITTKGYSGHQFLPDCLPNYGTPYNPDMADSPCVNMVVEPQHDPNLG